MGRAKVKMELISKETARNTTYKKRKEGLLRKMHEFTTLCDVSACIIIYGPGQENKPEIWPRNNLDEVHRMVEIYKSKGKDSKNKTFGLKDFLDDRQKKIEDDLSKLRRQHMEAKYPPPKELLDQMNEGQLRAFALALKNKAELVREKIEALKRSEMEMKTGPFYPPQPIYHQQQIQMHHLVNQSNNNMECASFKQEIFYERSLPLQILPRYYAPPLPYMVVPPQLTWKNQDGAH